MKRTEPACEFVVRGAQTEGELRAANNLMAKTQLPNYWDSIGWLESAGPVWTGVKREHTRIALDDAEMVGALRLLPLTLRIGKARLKAVGIGWVSTPPQHRGRGVCRALMQDALDCTRDSGAAFSLLYGIPDLYHRFGYVTMLPEYGVLVETRSVKRANAPLPRMRSVTAADIPALRRIHEAHESDASCSIVRTAAHYRSQFVSAAPKTPYWCDWPGAKALLDKRDRIIAYYMPQQSATELHMKELGTTDRASCDALLHAAADAAREAGLGLVRFHVPPYHPFARYLEEIDSVHQARHFANREGMMAVTNLEACLNAMLPEWREGIRMNGLQGLSVELTLVVSELSYRVISDASGLRVEKGRGQSRVPLNGQELTRLVTGFSHVEDVLNLNTSRMKDTARRFASALFPKRTPFIWPIDHF